MRKKTKYFILNKEEDFAAGRGAAYSEGKLEISQGYLSGIFDTGEKNTRWYRISSQFALPDNSDLRISIYTAEQDEIFYEGKRWKLEELIVSDRKPEEKDKILNPLKKKETKFSSDILITELTGRYLFFKIDSTVTGKANPVIYKMRIYFSPNMWVEELPEIYREKNNGFLERYLAVFQTIQEEMEEKIEQTTGNYDAASADYEFLQWLSTWYCMTEVNLWTEQQLRELLKNCYRFYRGMGTKKVLEEICTLYLGEKPEIIEYSRTHPNVFTVVVKSPALTAARQDMFRKIVDSCKPAHMEANVIFRTKEKGEAGIVLA
jgi:phage tail-like protein